MADSRRWKGSRVQRVDQFVRPPAFRDEHESDHLTPESAAWHGSGSRQVALAVGLAVAAGMAAVAFMLFVSPGGGDVSPQAPVAAEAQDGPLDLGEVTIPARPADGNGTTLPPLPGLPTA